LNAPPNPLAAIGEGVVLLRGRQRQRERKGREREKREGLPHYLTSSYGPGDIGNDSFSECDV